MMHTEKPILVYLANGVQGSAVVRQAVHRGYSVRALVRDPAKSDHLRQLGVEIAAADFNDRASLNDAHRGIDHVVWQIPLGDPARMELLVDYAIAAITMNGVTRVVAKTGAGKPSIQTDVPAFVLNQIIEDKLRASGVPFAIVRPTMYLDNFLRPGIREGICQNNVITYPLPARQTIAWTSTDDAARAALTLLESETFGGDYSVPGSEAVDGDELAAAFSLALKREIRFQSLPFEDFASGTDVPGAAAMAKRLATATLRFVANHPHEASAYLSRPFRPSPQLRGFQPTVIQQWVTEHRLSFA